MTNNNLFIPNAGDFAANKRGFDLKGRLKNIKSEKFRALYLKYPKNHLLHGVACLDGDSQEIFTISLEKEDQQEEKMPEIYFKTFSEVCVTGHFWYLSPHHIKMLLDSENGGFLKKYGTSAAEISENIARYLNGLPEIMSQKLVEQLREKNIDAKGIIENFSNGVMAEEIVELEEELEPEEFDAQMVFKLVLAKGNKKEAIEKALNEIFQNLQTEDLEALAELCIKKKFINWRFDF